MARWPRLAAAGSPGTSSVKANATKVMPNPRRIRAARRRPRNLRKRRDGSRGCHPRWSSSRLAARAGDVNGPGRVVVSARHAFGCDHHLTRLDEGEEGSVGVQLTLDLLKKLSPLVVVGRRSGLGAESLEAGIGARRPACPQTAEPARLEPPVLGRGGVVRAPKA